MTRRRAYPRLLAPALLAGAATLALAGCAASPEYAIAPGGSAGPAGRADPVRPAYPVSADDAARTAADAPSPPASAPSTAPDDDLAPGPRVAPAPVEAQPLDAPPPPPPAAAAPSAAPPATAASTPAPGLAYTEVQRREAERRHAELEARRRRAVAAKARALLPERREPDVRRYTLAKGDTLYGMGRRFGVEPKTMARALGVKLTATLQPGETVTLPEDAERGRHASAGARGELEVIPGKTIAPTRAERAAALAKAERAVAAVAPLELAQASAPPAAPPRRASEPFASKPFDLPPLPSRTAERPATAVRSTATTTGDGSTAVAALAPPPTHEVVPATPSSPRPYTSLGALGSSRASAGAPPSSRSGRRTEADAQAAYQVAAARAAARGEIAPPQPRAIASIGAGVESGRGRFRWPVRGEVLSGFGAKGPGQRNDGVDIAAVDGEPVHAAAAGEVVYAGHDVPALGNLVAVKHSDGWVTIYGNLQRITVRPRDKVGQGGQVGLAGASGAAARPQVHFEVRYAPSAAEKARPVDPQLVLPGAGSQAAG